MQLAKGKNVNLFLMLFPYNAIENKNFKEEM